MFGIGVAEIVIIAVLGLGCVGVVVAVVIAAVTGARRQEHAPQQPVIRCPHCGAVRPASDAYCGSCGQALPAK